MCSFFPKAFQFHVLCVSKATKAVHFHILCFFNAEFRIYVTCPQCTLLWHCFLTMDNCDICKRKIQSHYKIIACTICASAYMKCITLCHEYMIYLNSPKDIWYCTKCTIEIFHFNVIEEDLDCKSAIEGISFPPGDSFCYLSDKLFIPFELNDKDHASELRDADPDLNFYNITNGIRAKCNYYLESSFNEEVAKVNRTNDILSLCHTNIRSMKQNLRVFENYMQLLDHQFYWNLAARWLAWSVWTEGLTLYW